MLNDDNMSYAGQNLFNFSNNAFVLNYNDKCAPGAIIYTKNLQIIRVQTNNYLTEESLDYYA